MMVHRLKDAVVVLVGASSGIGAGIADHLLKEGAKVRASIALLIAHDMFIIHKSYLSSHICCDIIFHLSGMHGSAPS